MKQLEASKTNSPSAVNNSPTLTAVNALVSQNIAFIVRAYSSASANMTNKGHTQDYSKMWDITMSRSHFT